MYAGKIKFHKMSFE